jgi:glycosyltransferase involved in cell wall biosynthesis
MRALMIYYDVSDLLAYFEKHSRVVGVARVSTVTLNRFEQLGGSDKYKLIAYHPRLKKVVTTQAAIFGQKPFSAERFCDYFGVRHSKVSELDKYLLRNYDVKYKRIFHKLRLKIKSFSLKDVFQDKSGVDSVGKAIWVEPDFGPGDVVYLPGLTPTKSVYLERLKSAKSQDGIKIVQLIHDLIPVFAAQYVPHDAPPRFENFLLHTNATADVVLTVSEAAKKDYLRFLEFRTLPPNKVQAVPLAHEFMVEETPFANAPSAPDYRSLDVKVLHAARLPYVLCVGTREIRKNNWGLAQVWHSLQQKHGYKLPRLVFAGNKGWQNEEFERLLLRTNNLDDYIALVDSPSDAELAYLYQNCLFSVLPSFYEGWGLPIGESAWFGRPIIASCTSSMPEVAGDFADYIDPFRLETLEAAIEKMLDEDYREKRAAGLKNMPMRGWSQYADDIWSLLNSI